MRVLIVSTSPRKAFSTSLYFSNVMKCFLFGTQTQVLSLKTVQDYEAIVKALPDIDALVFATPVYVDTIPSTTLGYLQKLESHLVKNQYGFSVYALLNCGFYEGHQCALALNTYALWCHRAGVKWCGGIGIGSGVMLGFLRVLPLAGLALTALELCLRAIGLTLAGGFSFAALLSGYLPISLISQTLVWLLFSLGAFWNLFRLRTSIISQLEHSVKYTTAWFCPRFLFVWMASLYWVFRALLCHGVAPWRLFQRDREEI